MHRIYASDLAGAIHDTCLTLHEHGVIDAEKMNEFNESCLLENCMNADRIHELRINNHLSRSVFARHLGVAKEIVDAWEAGTAIPEGPALRLLLLLDKKGFEAIKL